MQLIRTFIFMERFFKYCFGIQVFDQSPTDVKELAKSPHPSDSHLPELSDILSASERTFSLWQWSRYF